MKTKNCMSTTTSKSSMMWCQENEIKRVQSSNSGKRFIFSTLLTNKYPKLLVKTGYENYIREKKKNLLLRLYI